MDVIILLEKKKSNQFLFIRYIYITIKMVKRRVSLRFYNTDNRVTGVKKKLPYIIHQLSVFVSFSGPI